MKKDVKEKEKIPDETDETFKARQRRRETWNRPCEGSHEGKTNDSPLITHK